MKLKKTISWLMGTIQQSLFPHLDEARRYFMWVAQNQACRQSGMPC